MTSFRFVLLCCVAVASMARADESFVGLAYADRGTLVYRETHWRFVADGAWTHVVVYACPDLRPFARKVLTARGSRAAPDFELDDARTGSVEGVRSTRDGREMYWRANRQDEWKAKAFAAPPDLVVDAGFDERVREAWDDLVRGATVQGQFAVPSRLKIVPFELIPEGVSGGQLVLSMRARTWYSFVVPRTEVRYDVASRRLVAFRGIGSIRSPNGANLPVRIEFPPELYREGVDAGVVRAALAEPLVGHCDARS